MEDPLLGGAGPVDVSSIGNLDEALRALFDFTGARVPGRSSLAVMSEAMGLLGNPHLRLRVVHITGTSGKTSTSYYVRAFLEASGKFTGMTVSPHIQSLNERVQVGGMPLDERVFCGYLEKMLHILEPMRGQLTYFELVICLALWVFASEKVEYAVVEVGIGGARDATNICFRDDKVAVITPVGLDHTEKLGNSIEQIAAQKAGIIVPGGVVLVARQSDEAMRVIQGRAREIGASLHVVDPAEGVFRPSYQRGNWALAKAAVAYLGSRDGFDLPDQASMEEYERVTPPARYEWFRIGGHRVLLDGAHNPQKMAGLVSAVQDQGLGPFPTLATLSTAPHDKLVQTLETMAPIVSHLIVPEFVLGQGDKVKTSMPAADVARIAAETGIEARVIPDLGAALDALLSDPAPNLLVTGSLYLAALVRPFLRRNATR